jgi:hypothetical protein
LLVERELQRWNVNRLTCHSKLRLFSAGEA